MLSDASNISSTRAVVRVVTEKLRGTARSSQRGRPLVATVRVSAFQPSVRVARARARATRATTARHPTSRRSSVADATTMNARAVP